MKKQAVSLYVLPNGQVDVCMFKSGRKIKTLFNLEQAEDWCAEQKRFIQEIIY